MEAAHAKGEDAEVKEGMQRERIQADAEVAHDADENQRHGIELPRQPCEHQRSAKRHHLRGKQEDHLTNRGKTKVGTDVDAVVDDGSHAIDVQEEGDQEVEDLLVLGRDLLDRAKDLLEHHGNVAVMRLGVVDLLIVLEQRHGDDEPPQARHAVADDLAQLRREEHEVLGQAARENVGNHRHDEGDAAADVAPCVAVGGDLVHTFFGGDVT